MGVLRGRWRAWPGGVVWARGPRAVGYPGVSPAWCARAAPRAFSRAFSRLFPLVRQAHKPRAVLAPLPVVFPFARPFSRAFMPCLMVLYVSRLSCVSRHSGRLLVCFALVGYFSSSVLWRSGRGPLWARRGVFWFYTFVFDFLTVFIFLSLLYSFRAAPGGVSGVPV